MRTKREDFIKEIQEEMHFRNVIREGISIIESKNKQEENQLRQIIKHLIVEIKRSNIKRHSSTGMNGLEYLISQTNFIEGLRSEFDQLASSKEQRDSFKQHILNAVENMFARDEFNRIPDEQEQEELDQDEQERKEEPESKLAVSPEGVDINISENLIKEQEEVSSTAGTFTIIPGLNRTGAIRAKRAWKNVEELIRSQLAGLPEEDDRQNFKQYLLWNLEGKDNPETGEWVEGYFDQWEEEVSGNVNRPQK